MQLVGRRTALELLLSARKLRVGEMVDLGLLDCVLEVEGGAVEQAEAWLEGRVCQGRGRQVVRAMKSMVTGEGEEARHFAPLWGGEDNKRALTMHLKHRE